MLWASIISLFLPLAVGCTAGSPISDLPSRIVFARARLLEAIPAGTDLDRANHLLTRSGFECKILIHSDFMETDGHEIRIFHKNIDFLYCSKEQSAGLFVAERWQIAVTFSLHEAAQRPPSRIVSDIFVSYGLTGL